MAQKRRKVTPQTLMTMKRGQEKIAMLTAYDYPMAKQLDDAGIDAMLVGDSMGMVVLGYDSTLPVEMADIMRATQAVARATETAMVIADMPFMSYALPEDALRNAGKFLKYGNADAVKLEGGRERERAVKLMTENGIATFAHIGLTPTYYKNLSGFKVQGKSAVKAEKLVEDALIMQEAGAFAIVLETIPWKVAAEITKRVKIPTIGIGAGPYCDGQILVTHDAFGAFNSEYMKPRFLKRFYVPKDNLYDSAVASAEKYIAEVRGGIYPETAHSYEIPAEIYQVFMRSLAEKDTREYGKSGAADEKALSF